ncbi:MAG: hypothetical protein HY318_11320 [Armatimonadetes bacterium]|nr:hypothetical protein [Armatimonadota bacterium]
MKRCTHCDQTYEQALEACPDCGYEGYLRVKTEEDAALKPVICRRCGEVVEAGDVSCPKCNESLYFTAPGCFITFLLLLNLAMVSIFVDRVYSSFVRPGLMGLQ